MGALKVFFRTVTNVILRRPRSMDSAPRDGTRILAYLSGGDRRFGEWREFYWNPFDSMWHAGEPPQTFADDALKGWVPLPSRPPLR